MSSTPYFPLYVADYLADTAHLTTEQHGAYMLLLMAAWPRGGSLPADPKKLARIARVSARRWHLVADDVMDLFDLDGDEIVSRRLEREHKKAVSKSEKRSAAGKRGGTAKALKDKQRGLANAIATPCHSPEPEPEEDTIVSSKGSPSGLVGEAVAVYRSICEPAGLKAVRALSKSRRASISARLKSAGPDQWREACERAARSPFLSGQNDRGWKADIDFIATESKFLKILEGSYDRPSHPPGGGSPDRHQSATNARRAALLRAAQDAAGRGDRGGQGEPCAGREHEGPDLRLAYARDA